MLKKCVSGTMDEAIESISKYKKETDIIVLGLPMVGDLLKNGLDMIILLRNKIVPRL